MSDVQADEFATAGPYITFPPHVTDRDDPRDRHLVAFTVDDPTHKTDGPQSLTVLVHGATDDADARRIAVEKLAEIYDPSAVVKIGAVSAGTF